MIDKFMEGFLVLHTADFDPSQDYWVHCYVIYKGQYWNLLVWFAVDQNILFFLLKMLLLSLILAMAAGLTLILKGAILEF